MTDAANTRFTTDELLPYAQGNATAFVLATIAYLKEHLGARGGRGGEDNLRTRARLAAGVLGRYGHRSSEKPLHPKFAELPFYEVG
jgi:hypothetical protein